jgi:WD40 repeat protein
MRALAAAVVLSAVAGCAGTLSSAQVCRPNQALLQASTAAQTEGRLARALELASDARAACADGPALLRVAEVLDDLGLARRAMAAYEEAVAVVAPAQRARVRQSMRELTQRPDPHRKPTAAQAGEAVILYRDGVMRRQQGDLDGALAQLRRSYALAPHPLTIVQIGMVHQAAGRAAEARRANERALAIAEDREGATAVPVLVGGHQAPLTAVAVGPDTVASASGDGTILVWERVTGRIVHRLAGHRGSVVALAFDRSGARLASSGVDRTVRVWDARAGRALARFPGSNAAPQTVALSSDGATVVYAAATVSVWNVADRRLRRRIGRAARSVAISPDGTALAWVDVDGAVQVAPLTGDQPATQLARVDVSNGQGGAVGFDRSGKLLAASDGAGTIVVHDLGSRRLVQTLRGPGGSFSALAFRPEPAALVGFGFQDGLRAWALDAGTVLAVPELADRNSLAAFSPEGDIIALALDDRTLALWSLDSGKKLRTIGGYGDRAWGLAFAPDGDLIAQASQDQTVKLWSLRGGALTHTLRGTDNRVVGVAFTPDGKRLVSGGWDGRLRLWEPRSGRAAGAVDVESQVFGVAVSPSGDAIAAVDLAGVVSTWETASGQQRAYQEREESLTGVAYAHDGKRLYAVGIDRRLTSWKTAAADGSLVVDRVVRLRGPLWSVAAAATGRVATGDDRGIVELLTADGRAQATLAGHRGRVRGMAFSPAGDRLVTASLDRTARIWDVATGATLHVLRGHELGVMAAAFHPGGRMLATASGDRTIKLWGADRGELLATLLATADGSWIVISPRGEVDGGGAAADLIDWKIGALRLPGFVGWERARRAGLLTRATRDALAR